MASGPEDRASARSDEPEARSDARWRVRANADSPDGHRRRAGRRWRRTRSAVAVAGAAAGSRPVAADGRGVRPVAGRLPAVSATREHVDASGAGGRRSPATCVICVSGRAGTARTWSRWTRAPGLANATLQLRVTVVRLFYDFLVEERVRDRNPVGRGYRVSGRARGPAWSGRRGMEPLPWIPTDAQWRAVLEVAAGESLRNRLMLALAYDAALRREELCLLATDDLDPAHRTIAGPGGDDEDAPRPGRAVFGGRGPAVGRVSARIAGRSRGAWRVVRVGVAAQPGGGGVAVDVVEGGALDRGARGRAGVQHAHAAASVPDRSRAVGLGAASDRVVRRAPLDGHDAALHPSVRPRSRRPAGERDDADPRGADRADRRGARMTALAAERSPGRAAAGVGARAERQPL